MSQVVIAALRAAPQPRCSASRCWLMSVGTRLVLFVLEVYGAYPRSGKFWCPAWSRHPFAAYKIRSFRFARRTAPTTVRHQTLRPHHDGCQDLGVLKHWEDRRRTNWRMRTWMKLLFNRRRIHPSSNRKLPNERAQRLTETSAGRLLVGT